MFDPTFHRHIVLHCKGHYKGRTLAQVIAAVAHMESRHVSDQDVVEHVVDAALAVLRPAQRPFLVHFTDVLRRGALEDGGTQSTLFIGLVSCLRHTALSELPFVLGEADLTFPLEDR